MYPSLRRIGWEVSFFCIYDGIWVLRTNTVYNTETVAQVYKALWTVEDIFRTTKSILETVPSTTSAM